MTDGHLLSEMCLIQMWQTALKALRDTPSRCFQLSVTEITQLYFLLSWPSLRWLGHCTNDSWTTLVRNACQPNGSNYLGSTQAHLCTMLPTHSNWKFPMSFFALPAIIQMVRPLHWWQMDNCCQKCVSSKCAKLHCKHLETPPQDASNFQ